MIEAARLRRARRRLRGYFLGSGVVLALLYLILGMFVIRLVGIELARYWSTAAMVAGVMLGGTYALIMMIWIAISFLQRLRKGEALIDNDD
ncbi:hypothetical protein [uncultured Sphingomonas sp.]|uniref:hypothetical protein n=1 Tax=uncultured Sphingomonas sp. TaxID=158754 RepID=UPI0025EC8F44|nr:hypothetical protein [uncultured Sphingomonas sp.]